MSYNSPVIVVVDSAASLPESVYGKACPFVVPMQIVINGKTYLDGCDLSTREFYAVLSRMTTPTFTSAPSPDSFFQTFLELGKTSSSILCVTVSLNFSASYNAASKAASDVKQLRPEMKIDVLDSQSAAGAQGLVALEACRAAKRGDSYEMVIDAAQTVIERVSLLAFPETLDYLRQSGRMPRMAYTGMSLLKIKPIFELSKGKIRNLAKPRTVKKASEKLVNLMSKRISGPVHATVMHADALEVAEQLKETIALEFQCEELFLTQFSPVMGSHTGPGLLGVAFWSET